MALWITANPMREARKSASRAGADRAQTDIAARQLHRRRHVESRGTIVCDADDPGRVDTQAAGHSAQIVGTELVAARSDRRPQHCGDDRFVERLERCADHPGGQSPPTGVHDRELALCTDQHDRGTVADPTSQNDAVEMGNCDVARRSIPGVGRVDVHHADAMALAELDPGQVDETSATRLEFGERNVESVEVAVVARRTPDLQVPAARLRDRDLCAGVT